MKKEELEIFYKLDKKSYCVEKNKTLDALLKVQGGRYQEEDIQEFVDKLIAWYNVKFSDQYIEEDLKETISDLDSTMLEIMNLEKLQQSFNTLQLELFTCKEREMEVILRYLVEMAGCGLIYSKSSCPKYGYYRADRMFEEFNDYFHWSLDVRIFDSIMERDYSPDNEEIIHLLEKRKKEKKEINGSKKLRTLRRFHSLLKK